MRVHRIRRLPRFLHALTVVHAVGAGACIVMAAGSAVSDPSARRLLPLAGAPLWCPHFANGHGRFLASLGGAGARVLVLESPSVGLADDPGGLRRRSSRESMASERRNPARMGGGHRERSCFHLREHTGRAACLTWR